MIKEPIDYKELRRLIRYKYGTAKDFAHEIGMSSVSLSKKLNNKTGFTSNEILGISEKLGIKTKEIPTYFFTKLV